MEKIFNKIMAIIDRLFRIAQIPASFIFAFILVTWKQDDTIIIAISMMYIVLMGKCCDLEAEIKELKSRGRLVNTGCPRKYE
jgi:hypothetical protein